MKKSIIILLLGVVPLYAQRIECRFKNLKNTEIILTGYEGFAEKELAKTTTDSLGNGVLPYPKNYVGAAILQLKGANSVIVLLNKENVAMQWEDFKDFNTLQFTNSPENDSFAKGVAINQEAEQKLAGLRYLLPLYKEQKDKSIWLQKETTTQEQVFQKFIAFLPESSFAKEYLQLRKFLGDMQLTHDRYKELERVAQHEKEFKKINFASEALWNSGLLKEILNSYYQLLEKYQEKKLITEHTMEANAVWIKALENQPTKQQEIAEFCFTSLERKGLTTASEQIALALLNKGNCQLTDKQTNLFEQYRKLAIGRTAPNIVFNLKNEKKQKDLKDLKNSYKLVVFGASWCPNCQTDYPSLIGKYKKLKETHDIEIVYVSIDTDKAAFEEYYKEAPFITYCDTKGWETQAAKEYHIFATPSYLLLDKELKILAKLQSPEHLEAWLVDENK